MFEMNGSTMNLEHKPVLLEPAIQALNIRPEGIYVDGTLGGAGHAAAILSHLSSEGTLVGIDKDPDALTRAGALFADKPNVRLVSGSYAQLKKILYSKAIFQVDGVLLDLGVSSFQLDDVSRGFSYMADAALDMRMDNTSGMTAAEVLNTYERSRLIDVIKDYGEEPFARKLADMIVQSRRARSFQRSSDLVELIRRGLGNGPRGMVAVKRVFQALRMEVNQELDDLRAALDEVIALLKPGARLVIITFHSLEDRMVKSAFKKAVQPCTCPPDFPRCVCQAVPTLSLVYKKPVLPDAIELAHNPRAKSAKMRVAEKR